jgi:hypothetical protein
MTLGVRVVLAARFGGIGSRADSMKRLLLVKHPDLLVKRPLPREVQNGQMALTSHY